MIMMKIQVILKMKCGVVSKKLSTPVILLFYHLPVFVVISLFNLEQGGLNKAKTSPQKL